MEEELTCTACKSIWRRIKVRGRKPILCPTCINNQVSPSVIVHPNNEAKAAGKLDESKNLSNLPKHFVYSVLHPRPSNYKDLLESTKKGSTWKCPSCNYILKLEIPVIDVPTHRCTPNTVTTKPFVRID